MKKGLNVLSLFGGMECGRIALDKAGIPVENYFSSEIDKHAIKVSTANYPGIQHMGDITGVHVGYIPDDYQTYITSSEYSDVFFDGKIDLLIGGSPCQGFSFAGKQLNFDDPRSALFFEYVRVLKCIQSHNPKVLFLLENVNMKKEYQDVISNELEVEPILINSALVSAGLRKRLYWTNIPNVQQPENLNIQLKDIIESGFVDRQKSFCLDANYWKGGNLEQYFKKSRRQLVFDNTQAIQVGKASEINYEQRARVYSIDGKCPTLSTCCGGHHEPKIKITEDTWRKLTPIECERVHNVPDNYTESVSNTQRYKMIGNGWEVNTITHIFKNIPQ